MPISETARKNQDELFPNHVATLAVTDPELIEVVSHRPGHHVFRGL
jgi:4-carboxymuconolactone decarboxylase